MNGSVLFWEVLWCFLLNPHQPYAHLKIRRWERNTNELREQPRWLEDVPGTISSVHQSIDEGIARA